MLSFILRPFARYLVDEAIERAPEIREAFGIPDLSDLDDQIVEKLPDFGALVNRFVDELMARLPAFPFFGGR